MIKVCTDQIFFVSLHRFLKTYPILVIATTNVVSLSTNLGNMTKIYDY